MTDGPSDAGAPIAGRRGSRYIGPLATRLLRSRIAANVSGTLYLQLVQIAIQFGSVPILTLYWGLRDYGIWLILFTFPSYIAMADLGFAAAAINDMTMRTARGDRHSAAATFKALKLILLIMSTVVLLTALVVIYVLFPDALTFANTAAHGHARLTMLSLVAYGVMALASNAICGGYRSVNLFAYCTYIYVTFILAEAVVALALVAMGGGLLGAALGYLVIRSISNLVLAIVLRRKVPWLHATTLHDARSRIRPLLEPAVSALALPAAQALTLQGAVLIIGSAVGPAAVPLFTTIRTLTRTALQFTMMVNLSAMPAFSIAAATDDRMRKAQLVLLCLAVGAVMLLPAAPALLVLGRPIVLIWTHGRVDPSSELLFVMVVTMLLNGTWMPLSNFILAMNHHGSFSYFYLLVSGLGIALAYPLGRHMGSEGVAIALTMIDAVMLVRIMVLARRYHMLDSALFRGIIRQSIDALRNRRLST